MHALRCGGSARHCAAAWPAQRQCPRPQAAVHSSSSSSSSRPVGVLLVDLDSIVDTAPLHTLCALHATHAVFPAEISPPGEQGDPTADGSRTSSATEASSSPLLQLNLAEQLCRLADPSEAVLLLKLLHDELVTGRQQHRMGKRRTRPFRLAEVTSAVLHSREELLDVCVARWALAGGVTPTQLKQQTQVAFAGAVQQLADSPAVGEWLPASASAAPTAPSAQQGGAQPAADPRDVRDRGGLAGAAAALARAHAVPATSNLVRAAREHFHVEALSTWPPRLTAALAARSGLPFRSAEQLVEGNREGDSGGGGGGGGSGGTAGLYVSCATSFEEGVLARLERRAPHAPPRCFVVTTNAHRAARAASACAAWQARPGGAEQRQRRPHVEVLLSDALATSAQARVALSQQQQQHEAVTVVDDARLADTLGLSGSRLVMDGVRCAMALAVDTAAALIVALCIVGTAASFAAQRWRPAVSSALLLALGLCFQRAPLIWSQQTQAEGVRDRALAAALTAALAVVWASAWLTHVPTRGGRASARTAPHITDVTEPQQVSRAAPLHDAKEARPSTPAASARAPSSSSGPAPSAPGGTAAGAAQGPPDGTTAPAGAAAAESAARPPSGPRLASTSLAAGGGNGGGGARSPALGLQDMVFSQLLRALDASDITSVRLVCREWRALVSCCLDRARPRVLRHRELPATWPHLKTLDLGACVHGLRPSSLRAVLQGLGHLTDLNLGACSSASSTACSSSSLLAPSGAAAAGEEGAAALGQAPGRQEGEGHTVAAAAAAGPAPDMTAAFSVTDRCVLEVARSKVPLRAIGLAQCVHLADPGLMALARVTTLRRVELTGCVSVTDVGVLLLTQLPHLEHLGVAWCLKLSNAGFKAMSGAQGTLTSLAASGCPLVTEQGLATLGALTALRRLELGHMGGAWSAEPAVTDAVLAAWSGLRHLTCLVLGAMQAEGARVSDASVAALALHHPRLARLSLCHLTRGVPSRATLEVLATHLAPTLTHLTLNTACLGAGGNGDDDAAAGGTSDVGRGLGGGGGVGRGVWGAAGPGRPGAVASSRGAGWAGGGGEAGPLGFSRLQDLELPYGACAWGGGEGLRRVFGVPPKAPGEGAAATQGVALASASVSASKPPAATSITAAGTSSSSSCSSSSSASSSQAQGGAGVPPPSAALPLSPARAVTLPAGAACRLTSFTLTGPHRSPLHPAAAGAAHEGGGAAGAAGGAGAAEGLGDDCLAVLGAATGRTLRSLVLWSFSGTLASADAVCGLASLPHLTRLELLSCAPHVGDAGLCALARAPCAARLSHLTLGHLNASQPGASPAVGGLQLLSACTALTSLALPHSGDLVNDWLVERALATAPMQQQGGRGAARAPLARLAALHVSGSAALTDAGVRCLARGLRALRQLALVRCARVTGAGLLWAHGGGGGGGGGQRAAAAAAAAGPAGVCWRALLSLSLASSAGVTDAGVRAACAAAPRLTSLDLSQCALVTDEGVAALSTLPSLTYLDLQHCSRVGDEGLRALAHLTSLVTLRLNGCVHVSDAGVGFLASPPHACSTSSSAASPSGAAMAAAAAPAMGDGAGADGAGGGDVAIQRAPGGGSRLLTLQLDKCIRLTDAAAHSLGRMTSLTSLRLARCPEVTDAGVRCLARLTRLSTLSLAHCGRVTEGGIGALAPLTALVSLEI